MGPSLYDARHGAVLEVAVVPDHAAQVLAAWCDAARVLLDALGWHAESVRAREWPGGLGLFVTAPVDGLLAATEVTEQALVLAEARLAGTGTGLPTDDLLARLRVHQQHERSRPLAALVTAARQRGLVVTFDDERVGVGAGRGCISWPLSRLPAADEVAWDVARDIPVAFVTGSNGKTTTTRLLAAMLRAAGHTTGHTCTDGVYIDGVQVESGDWSGPAGARRVLQDDRVDAAVLETARGGVLRRGLAIDGADVAVVTRVAADHFGEYGVHDLLSLGEAKLVVARGLRPGAPVILNADDDTLVALTRRYAAPIAWFSLDAANPVLAATSLAGGLVATVRDDRLMIARGAQPVLDVAVRDIPITLGGAARHNVANALAASLAAVAVGVPPASIVQALHIFGSSAADNPGRLQVRQVRGATVIVDFVHNADGWRAILAMAAQLRGQGGRLIVTLGQAGDRHEADLDEMARVVWEACPDRIILKEMEEYLRGRPYGQVSELLGEALRRAGAPDSALMLAPSEHAASEQALQLAGEGDVVIIATHADYADVIALVESAGAQGG